MAKIYFLTGKLGSGKSLCAVGKIRDYLQEGRRVATNLDLNLEHLVDKYGKADVVRLPDFPRLEDLELLGYGDGDDRLSGKVDDSRAGLLVLDELAMQFNTRNWRDKDRLQLIGWFRHARKLGWDVILLAQDLDSLDGQVVNALCEHYVTCSRLDRLSIKFLSSFLRIAGIESVLPKIHVAAIYYGQTTSALKVGRWWYRGRDLYPAFDNAANIQ